MSLFALELTSEVTVPVPPAAVRATFEDAASWPRWCGPVAAVHTAPEAWEAGARLHYTLASAVPVSFDVTLDQVDDTVVAWSSTKGPIRGVRTWRFEACAEGTRVTDHKRFSSRVLPIWLFYPRPPIRRMSRRWLADLATEATRRQA